MFVTAERLGISLALYSIFSQPAKAPCILCQTCDPHWSMKINLKESLLNSPCSGAG